MHLKLQKYLLVLVVRHVQIQQDSSKMLKATHLLFFQHLVQVVLPFLYFRFYYPQGLYREIMNTKAYTSETLLGQVGGFVGIQFQVYYKILRLYFIYNKIDVNHSLMSSSTVCQMVMTDSWKRVGFWPYPGLLVHQSKPQRSKISALNLGPCPGASLVFWFTKGSARMRAILERWLLKQKYAFFYILKMKN